jgi:hypothetical protein
MSLFLQRYEKDQREQEEQKDNEERAYNNREKMYVYVYI